MELSDSRLTAADLLADFDWDDLLDVEACTRRWFNDVKGRLNIRSEGNSGLRQEKFNSNKINKHDLSFWLADAADFMQRQAIVIERFKDIIDIMKTEAIADKTKVIKAQERLLECQNDQLGHLKSAVESTVQITMQNEMKSYSEALGDHTNTETKTTQVQESLKKAVKSAIEEEDRSKNLVVFGLDESDTEQIDSQVRDLFFQLGEKPRVGQQDWNEED